MLVVGIVAGTCVLVYVLSNVLGLFTPSAFCDDARAFLWRAQLFRPYTSLFFHMGVLHLALNLLALVMIAGFLERNMGSVMLGTMLVLFPLLAALLRAAVAFVLQLAVHWTAPCAIGLSGFLFACMVVELERFEQRQVSVFGLFQMRTRWYPWLVLFITQLVFPFSAQLCHLAGILVAYAYCAGWFDRLFPSLAWRLRIQENTIVKRLPGFCATRSDDFNQWGLAATMPLLSSQLEDDRHSGQDPAMLRWIRPRYASIPDTPSSASTPARSVDRSVIADAAERRRIMQDGII
ncbi:Rhomboid-like protein 15 [Porphyridium purpureum]|uniref:Rhomboid-like protein 15 n=1 Tax=Porphyridium purpureum TaxID=35688 RepID=A0A5J4Z7U3_PORPP|nr:Rhomboid-like protein 15 [Porphyridium purpureum]|eukprot:POR2106..scf295_1